MSKQTIQRDSVFRSTTPAPKVTQGLSFQEDKKRQTAVWLSDEEMQWLDAQCTDIKNSGWRSVTRSSFIRALVHVAMEYKTDVKGVTGEVELIQRLTPSS
jgi:hypothetical protein